jgi:cell division septum initiation protein DivIVA
MELVQNGLDARSSAVTESLVENALNIARVMNEGVEKISSAVDPMALETLLTQRIADLNTTVTNRTKQLQDTLTDQGGVLQTLLENKGPMLVERLTARGHEIAQEVASVAELVTEAIIDKSSSIIERFGETSIEITRSFDKSTADLQKLFENGTGTTIQALLTTNEKLKDDLSEVLARLAETSLALNGVVHDAGDSLEAIEGTLTNRVRDFQGSVTAISNQINNLNTTSLSTLSQTDALVTRLNEEHDNLATSANSFAQSQREIDRLLQQRNQSLEALLSNVHSKTDEMESVLDSFTSIFEEAIRKADIRAREIGTYMSDMTQGLSSQIGTQFEDIRNSGAKERERTANAMRALYDQANEEMTKLFEQSLSRFQSSAAELRSIASQVQQDIDAARQEVRRGATELPRETAEQAAALRRVVGDQISALKQLTDIVNKAGQPLDIAQPAAASSFQPLPPAAPYRAPEPYRTPESLRPPEPLRSPEPLRAQEPFRAPPIMTTPMVDPVPPIPRDDYSGRGQRNTPAPAAPRAQAGDRGQGWISDLLARASREDQRTAGNAPISSDPLQGISLDIASMVDHLAVSDVWDRYNRGERNIFSRRLYTAQGQQTFDEIRRRYRAEPDFRETVNRYNREFERLLNEISRDDRDGGMVRSYLISDTGKVYTMLAHAAGRLD